MTSFFSSLGNTFTAMHMYTKLYSMPEFRNFTDYLNEGSLTEVLTQFFRNTIVSYLDPIVEASLNDKEYTSIFDNKTLTKTEQCKLFSGKILNKLYDTHAGDFQNLMHMDKRLAMEYVVSTFNDIKEVESVKNGRDVYTLLVNACAEKVRTFILQRIVRLQLHRVNEESVLKVIESTLKWFNEMYTYDSKLLNESLLGNKNDSSSDNSDSDGEATNNNTNKPDERNNMNKNDKMDTAPIGPLKPQFKPATPNPHPMPPAKPPTVPAKPPAAPSKPSGRPKSHIIFDDDIPIQPGKKPRK